MAEARRHEQVQLDGDLDGDNQSENSVNTAVTSVSNLAIQVCTASLTVHTVVLKCTYFEGAPAKGNHINPWSSVVSDFEQTLKMIILAQ